MTRGVLGCLLAGALALGCAPADPVSVPPAYRPSAFSEAPVDITNDDYGAFGGAPRAPGIGAVVPDFELPVATGGRLALADLRSRGDVVIVFFRGFW